MNLGKIVQQRRTELGLSQEELAIKMGYKSRSSINKIENGRPVTQKIIFRLAEALNTTPAHLMGWDQEEINAVSEVQEDANTYEEQLEADFKSLYEEFGELHFTHSDIEKVQKIMRNIQRRNACDVILELELTDEEIDEVYKYAKYLISIRK